jgi:excisionase family DNA binding protein
MEPLAVPIPEAARLGGVGRSTLYAEISKGNLKIRKVGRRTIVAMDDLKTWLASKAGEAA